MKHLKLAAGLFCSAAALYAQGAAGSASVPAADRRFATMVAQTDVAEIEVANMAAEKSSNDQVKKLAQKLVEDHTKTSDSMKQIASSKGITLPTEPDAKHKALSAKLKNESGAQFDRDFLAANSADHHKVVAAFQKESSTGGDAEIKAFAAQYLPAIEEHTKMIDDTRGGSK